MKFLIEDSEYTYFSLEDFEKNGLPSFLREKESFEVLVYEIPSKVINIYKYSQYQKSGWMRKVLK